jgi:hypothetical protein
MALALLASLKLIVAASNARLALVGIANGIAIPDAMVPLYVAVRPSVPLIFFMVALAVSLVFLLFLTAFLAGALAFVLFPVSILAVGILLGIREVDDARPDRQVQCQKEHRQDDVDFTSMHGLPLCQWFLYYEPY